MSLPVADFSSPAAFDVDDLLWTNAKVNFRVTRSGRAFSPWDSAPISTAFTIATAVSQAVNSQAEEDLAEPDSGDTNEIHPPSLASDNAPLDPIKTLSRRKHDKAGSKLRRHNARQAEKVRQHVEMLPPMHRPTHVKNAGPAVKTTFEFVKQRAASTGWIGLHDDGRSEQEKDIGFQEPSWTLTHTLESFFGPHPDFPGFTLGKYLGLDVRPILDGTGKVFAVHAGRPDDPNWMRDVHDPAVKAMEDARAQCKVSEERSYHRRGNWPPLSAGDSHGGGQLQPGALVNGVINAAVLCCLLSNIAFIRMAGFATGVFANWAPNLFQYYTSRMQTFYKRYTHLQRPFLNSIWCTCTFNLGPRTCSIGHRDFANLAFGWCAITALGDYDFTKGGHLILWDCKLILEFPPGTTILMPSAAIFHSNIGIGPNERRYSFTQYTAGGIFRWIEHGFRSEEEYMGSLLKEEQEREQMEAKGRWSMGAGLYSTLAELKK
ncbi:hypothetical protein C8R46DRAFT_1032047 [Mycena filopes]|nr:hypothetical protein C8R46DRAFT_1032047 [Mycena filopes]